MLEFWVAIQGIRILVIFDFFILVTGLFELLNSLYFYDGHMNACSLHKRCVASVKMGSEASYQAHMIQL